MRRFLTSMLIMAGCISLFTGCKDESTAKEVPEDVTFMIISDIHYFDPSLFSLPANADFQTYLVSDRKLIIESSAILKNVLAIVLNKKPDFLLVPGDLTKDGEEISHKVVAALFEELTQQGIKVLVIPGNHDVNNPAAESYLGNTKATVKNVTATEFASIYGKCGYNNAVHKDPNSLSYVSEPVNGVWVMGMDACHYSAGSETVGSLSTQTQTWVKSMISEAKKQNKILLSMMHHGILEHFTGQSSMFSEYVISDWDNISTTLAESGLNVVFTGHFHAQDIAKKTTSSSFIYDIETGSTVTSPCPYRMVTLNTVKNTMKVETGKIDGVTYSTIPTGMSFQNYAKTYLKDGMKTISFYMLSMPPYSIPTTYISALKLDSIMSNAFIAHYAGDETATINDQTDIQTVTAVIPLLGGPLQSVWSDLAPKDNAITIQLKTGVATTE